MSGPAPDHDRVVRTLVLVAMLAGTGCGGTFTVTATVPRAPEVPVRVFPQIVVVPGLEPDDAALAAEIHDHLVGSGRSEIILMSPSELALLRSRGRIPETAVVLEVTARIVETTRPSFRTRPETICSPWGGCSIVQQRTIADVPVVRGHLRVRVSDGPTGQLLQEVEEEASEDGSDALSMRLRVLVALRERARSMLDASQREVRVELVEVDDTRVREALELLRHGDASGAREVLEPLPRGRGFEALPAETRAAILFDIGQARRLDASVDDRLELAAEALSSALALDPRPLFARALEQVRDEHAERERLRAHEAAADHNFGLATSPRRAPAPRREVPSPPPAYGE